MQAKAPPQDRILDAAMRVFRRHGFRRAAIERLYETSIAAEVAAARKAEEARHELADILVVQIGARLKHLFASLDGSPHLDELFSEHLAQARDLYQAYSTRFSGEVEATIARVCRARKLKLNSGVSVRELARCVEMAVHGTKSAYPSMQPVDAFLKQLETMLRMLIAGAMALQAKKAPTAKKTAPVAKKSPRKT